MFDLKKPLVSGGNWRAYSARLLSVLRFSPLGLCVLVGAFAVVCPRLVFRNTRGSLLACT
jgi:hypothetical protein